VRSQPDQVKVMKVALLIVGALAAAGCKDAAGPTPAPAAPGPRWEAGGHYTYDVSGKSKTEMDAGQVLLDMRLSGVLELRAGSTTAGEVELAASMRDVRVTGAGAGGDAKLDELAGELARPWRITMRDGRVEELGLPRDCSAAAAGLDRTLAAALQFGVGTTTEHDATGRYTATYEPTGAPGRFTKRKVAYETVLVGAPGGARLQIPGISSKLPEVISSHAEIEIAEGRLRSTRDEEELRASLGVGAPVRSKTSLTLILAAVDQAPAPASGAPADLVSLRPDEPYAPPAPPLQLDATKTAGWTFARAIAEIEALDRARPPTPAAPNGAPEAQDPAETARAQKLAAAFGALSAFLRQDPKNIPRAVALARKNGAVAQAVMDALSAAGSGPGQKALLDLALDAKLPRGLREGAAGSLIRTAQPTDETIRALTPLMTDPVLDEYAVYGLGTYSRKLREAGQTARAARINELLAGQLAAARTESQKVTVLRGIANSGNAGALDAVRPYFASKSESVRAAAVQALRLMDHPAVDPLIAERMENDEKPAVRYAAFSAAAPRRVTPVLAGAVERAAIAAPDAQGRMLATRLLARWLPDRETVRPTLQKIASSDAEPRIRDEARRALGGG
jgi:hypothetical protein